MYAVLQTSLDQPITREVLESAVMATQQFTKPDCARLQGESFGILVGSLSQDDALALQAALRARGVETEVVDESNLPALPMPYRPQSFTTAPEGVTVADYTEQTTLLLMSTFVFAAAGHLKHLANIPHRNMEFVQKYIPRGGIRNVVEMVPDHEPKEVQEFRIEFYFTQDPFRFQFVLDDKAIIRANGQVLKLRDKNQLDSLLLTFANTFPADQTNLGIQKILTGQEFTYPSVHAFEQEIIWSLHRLARKPD
jgi:hypothetical protein